MKTLQNIIFLTLVAIIGCNLCKGQVGSFKRVVLKNGSEFKGILLQDGGDTIKILTEEDHIYLFKRSEVSEIIDQKKSASLYISEVDNKRWYSTTNFLCDFDATDQLGFGVETFLGVKHHKHFQNGIGVGFKQDLGWYDYEPFTMHIAIQNRINLLAQGSTPFIAYEPAYLVMLNDGLQQDLYKKFAQSFELGYRFYRPKKRRSFNLSAAVLRRVGQDLQYRYNPVTRSYNYEYLGWIPEYKMVLKFGWQL